MKVAAPNILYLHCHDAGRCISPMGYPCHTPALAKLAGDALLFRNAHAAAPTCSPSRAALLTGMAPHSCGMYGLAHLGWSLESYSDHLIHSLHRRGYHSALAGVQHIRDYNEADVSKTIGYRERVEGIPEAGDPEGIAAHDLATGRAAAAWLKKRGKADAPFFLSCGFIFPHREFTSAEPARFPWEDSRYVASPPHLPDTNQVRRDVAEYNASVRFMDQQAGLVLEALNTSGLSENTIIIATTDHGIAFPGMKCNLTDKGTGVYLMLKGPGIPGGVVNDALVSHLDVFPTLCDLLEMEKPGRLHGHSLMPLIRGEAEEVNTEVFGEVTYHAAYEPMRSIRTKTHLLIRNFDDEWMRRVLPNCDDGYAKTAMLETGWGEGRKAPIELYNLVQDPECKSNLAGLGSQQDLQEELEGRLLDWMRRTGDRLLDGPVDLPDGGKMSPVDGVGVGHIRGKRKFAGNTGCC